MQPTAQQAVKFTVSLLTTVASYARRDLDFRVCGISPDAFFPVVPDDLAHENLSSAARWVGQYLAANARERRTPIEAAELADAVQAYHQSEQKQTGYCPAIIDALRGLPDVPVATIAEVDNDRASEDLGADQEELILEVKEAKRRRSPAAVVEG